MNIDGVGFASNRKFFWFFIFITTIIGIFLFWHQIWQPGILYGGEIKSSLNYWQWLKPLLLPWSATGSYGFATTSYYINAGMPEFYAYSAPTMTPLILLFGLMGALFKGNGPITVYVLSFPLQYLGWYYLLPYFGVKKNLPLLSFVAFSVFVLNPYKTEGVIASGMVYGLNHAIWLLWLSSMLALFVTTIKKQKIDSKRLAIYFILSWLSTTLAVGMLVITAYTGLFIVLYYLIQNRKKRENVVLIIKLVLYSFLWLFLVNNYFLLPTIFSEESVLKTVNNTYPLPNSLEEIFRISLGSKSANSNNNLFLVIPVLALIGLSFGKIRHRLLIVAIFIIGLVFTTGLNDPFASINEWLYDNLPLLSFGRSTHRYLVLVLTAYSLGAVALINIKTNIKNYKIIPILFFILLVTTYNQSLFSGNRPGLEKVQPPAKYEQINEWFRQNHKPSDPAMFFSPVGIPIKSVYPWFAESAMPSPFDSLFVLPANQIGGQVNAISGGARFSHFIIKNVKKDPNLAIKMLDRAKLKTVFIDDDGGDKNYIESFKAMMSKSSVYELVNSPVSGFIIYQNQDYADYQTTDSFDLLVGDFRTLKFPHISQMFIYLNDPLNDSFEILSECKKCRVIFGKNQTSEELLYTNLLNKYELKPTMPPIKKVFKEGGWLAMSDLYSFTEDEGLFTYGKYPVGSSAAGSYFYDLRQLIRHSESDEWLVLARINHRSNQHGVVEFSYNNKFLNAYNSQQEESNFKIYQVGVINDVKNKLVVSNVSNPSAGAIIDSVIVVPASVYKEQTNKLNNLLSSHPIYNVEQLDLSSEQLINLEPNINNKTSFTLNKPLNKYLYLNQSPNINWRLAEKKPVTANYFASAYLGEAENVSIKYRLTPFFYAGIMITLLSWIFCLKLLLTNEPKFKK